MSEEETKGDPPKLIYDLPECFMMTWEELMGMTSIVGYDIWSEDVIETTITRHPQMGGDTSNPKQITKPPQMGGDTSNPNQITKHQHMGGDTSNPNQITHTYKRGETLRKLPKIWRETL